MPNRIAAVLAGAVALSMATAGIAAANSVDGDADVVISGTQSMINLGTVAGGSTHTLEFGFDLVCKGTNHVPVGTTIDLTPAPTAPAGGTIDATPASVGPVPDDWPGAGEAVHRRPGAAGDGPLPRHADRAVRRRDELHLQGGIHEVAGRRDERDHDGPGRPVGRRERRPRARPPGRHDRRGQRDRRLGRCLHRDGDRCRGRPRPDGHLRPASGSLFPLGTTSVACSATDSGGLTANGSFSIHVVDTTAPQLGSLPSPSASTADAGGTTVSWAAPAATDVVDPSPSVDCLPASGSAFPVGTTTVTCTATDDSGNGSSGTFDVTVTFDAPPRLRPRRRRPRRLRLRLRRPRRPPRRS